MPGRLITVIDKHNTKLPSTFTKIIREKSNNFISNLSEESLAKVRARLSEFTKYPRKPTKEYQLWLAKHKINDSFPIATSEYINSIVVSHLKTVPSLVSYSLGILNKQYKNSTLTTPKLANIFEFGTIEVPPYPHFHTTFLLHYKFQANTIAKKLSSYLFSSLNDYLRTNTK